MTINGTGWDFVYCSLIGLYSFVLLREWFGQRFLTPPANTATSFGLIIFVAEGIATHQPE